MELCDFATTYRDFAIRAAVVDNAAEHVATGDPLTAILVIVDLFLPRRFFGDRLVPGGQESFLSCEDAVEHVISRSVMVAMSGPAVRRVPAMPESAWSIIASSPWRV